MSKIGKDAEERTGNSKFMLHAVGSAEGLAPENMFEHAIGNLTNMYLILSDAVVLQLLSIIGTVI